MDVREPREFQRGHIPRAQLRPFSKLLTAADELSPDQALVLVCRGGRRSARAAHLFHTRGYRQIAVLRGGMLAWEAAGLLEAID